MNTDIDDLIEYIENRCQDNTLCLDTCNYSQCFEKVYDRSDKNLLENCIHVINDWKSTDFFKKGYVHSIVLRVSGKNHRILFNHGFTLISLTKNKFIICDSWESIHKKRCRSRLVSLDDIENVLLDILTPTNNIKLFDNIFNDDMKNNWIVEINELKDKGEYTQEFSSEKIMSILNKADINDLKRFISITVYKPSIINGGVQNKKRKKTRRRNKQTKTRKRNK